MESAVKYKSAFLASGKIDPLFNILASKNNKGKKEFPPKISLIKTLQLLDFIKAIPPDNSGKAVINDNIVAPKTTPEMFIEWAMCSLVSAKIKQNLKI